MEQRNKNIIAGLSARLPDAEIGQTFYKKPIYGSSKICEQDSISNHVFWIINKFGPNTKGNNIIQAFHEVFQFVNIFGWAGI